MTTARSGDATSVRAGDHLYARSRPARAWGVNWGVSEFEALGEPVGCVAREAPVTSARGMPDEHTLGTSPPGVA